jgi:hypothetical protein
MLTSVKEPLAYGSLSRPKTDPLPGYYWYRVLRPLSNSHLESALALLDEASPSPSTRALIQEAMGEIRQGAERKPQED